MVKRLLIIFLTFLIISAILLFKSFLSHPELFARYLGTDVILNSPLIETINIEKLYTRDSESLDFGIINIQIEQAKNSLLPPEQKELLIKKLEGKIELLKGHREIQDIDDAMELFKASDQHYSKVNFAKLNSNGQFFIWQGPLKIVADEYYIITYDKPDILEMKIRGFAFKNVRKWLTHEEIPPGTFLVIVGRYTGFVILSINNQKFNLPRLEDCYVSSPSES